MLAIQLPSSSCDITVIGLASGAKQSYRIIVTLIYLVYNGRTRYVYVVDPLGFPESRNNLAIRNQDDEKLQRENG